MCSGRELVSAKREENAKESFLIDAPFSTRALSRALRNADPKGKELMQGMKRRVGGANPRSEVCPSRA